jgi:hypothetical protein
MISDLTAQEQLDIQHRDYEGRHGSFGSGRLLRRGPAAGEPCIPDLLP